MSLLDLGIGYEGLWLSAMVFSEGGRCCVADLGADCGISGAGVGFQGFRGCGISRREGLISRGLKFKGAEVSDRFGEICYPYSKYIEMLVLHRVCSTTYM